MFCFIGKVCSVKVYKADHNDGVLLANAFCWLKGIKIQLSLSSSKGDYLKLPFQSAKLSVYFELGKYERSR